jgi:hypothetical protein
VGWGVILSGTFLCGANDVAQEQTPSGLG